MFFDIFFRAALCLSVAVEIWEDAPGEGQTLWPIFFKRLSTPFPFFAETKSLLGKSFFRETYKSFIIYDKSTNSINVTNIEGPLKHLENRWTFRQTGDSSEVDFHVDFELKNKILNILMIKTFDLGLKKIADAFEKRANDLFNKT